MTPADKYWQDVADAQRRRDAALARLRWQLRAAWALVALVVLVALAVPFL